MASTIRYTRMALTWIGTPVLSTIFSMGMFQTMSWLVTARIDRQHAAAQWQPGSPSIFVSRPLCRMRIVSRGPTVNSPHKPKRPQVIPHANASHTFVIVSRSCNWVTLCGSRSIISGAAVSGVVSVLRAMRRSGHNRIY